MRVTFLLFLALLPGIPLPVRAQSPLDEVEALLGQGRVLLAREVLQSWMDRDEAGAGRLDRQRGIWLRAILTVDPGMAALDLQRLVLEFPGGPYSDDALLRLAQAAELHGDLRAAHLLYTDLDRSYPSSPNRERARSWLDENREAVEALASQPTTPSRPSYPAGVLGGVGEDPEPTLGPLSVQLGAFRSLEGARSLASSLTEAGFQPRIVRVEGSDLIRVRVGRFSTREEAVRLRDEFEARGLEAGVVSDATAEEEIGG